MKKLAINTPADVVRVSRICRLVDIELANIYGIGTRYLSSKEREVYMNEREKDWYEKYRKEEDERYYKMVARETSPRKLWKYYEWGEGNDRVENERSSNGPRSDAALARIVAVLTPQFEKAKTSGDLQKMRWVEKNSPKRSDLRKAVIKEICLKANGRAISSVETSNLPEYALVSKVLLGDVLWAFDLPLTIFDERTRDAKSFDSLWWVICNNPHLSQNWMCAIKGQAFGQKWDELWGKPGSPERSKMIGEIRSRILKENGALIPEWFLIFQFILADGVGEEEKVLANELINVWLTQKEKGSFKDVGSLIAQLKNTHPYTGVVYEATIERLQNDLFDRLEKEKEFVVTPDAVSERREVLKGMGDKKRQERVSDRILCAVSRVLETENRRPLLRKFLYPLNDGLWGRFRGVHADRRREMAKEIVERIYGLSAK